MREHLLGYLIGALDPDEVELVERRIKEDPTLEQDLEVLRVGLEPLAAGCREDDPPAGLAGRTCQFVAARRTVVAVEQRPSRAARWGFQDIVIAAGILLAASLLFFPALNQSRFQAQRRVCQDNLRRLGVALVQYSGAHRGAFPYIPPTGNLASAALYAPALFHSGLVSEKRRFLCPGCPRSDDPEFDIPTVQRLVAADGEQAKRMRETMGGSYSFTLGHLVDDRYVGTRNQGRPKFALLSDTPCTMQADTNSVNHTGNGQNVLFEDGHVEFLRTASCPQRTNSDNIFANDHGVLGPGAHVNDSVITPGWIQPAMPVGVQIQ